MKKSLRLYYKVDRYNRIKVLKKIEKMLKEEGATILNNCGAHIWTIKARTSSDNEEYIKKVESLPGIKIRSDSKWSVTTLSLRFILNGYYYSISYEENPLFPIYWHKIKVDENGSYKGSRYLSSNESINDKCYRENRSNDTFTLAYDCVFKVLNDRQLKEIAKWHYESIKRYVINGSESEVTSEKVRVNNYYDGGYHYERVYNKDNRNIYNILQR